MRALDSAVLDDAVATQDTITQLIAAIRRVGREVPRVAQAIAARCTAHNYDALGKPAIASDDKAAKDALVSALVNDALTITAAFEKAAAEAEVDERACQALALLALVAGQDVEPAEDSDGVGVRADVRKQVRANAHSAATLTRACCVSALAELMSG